MSSIVETGEKAQLVATGDGCGDSDEANKDTREENALREMWQQCEDPEEKRQLRTRMYKLREDRLRDFYGRDGQEILDSILKVDNVSGGLGEVGNVEESRSMTSVASMVVTTSEIQSGQMNTFNTSQSTQAKKSVSATIELSKVGLQQSSKKILESNSSSSENVKEDLKQIKNRISTKNRSLQLKEIEEQKNSLANRRSSSSRRKSSVGENEIITVNVRKASPKQSKTIITTSTFNNNTNNNSKGKVVVNNIRNGMGTEEGERKSRSSGDRVSRRERDGSNLTTGENTIASTNGRSPSVTTKSTMDGRKVNNMRTSEVTSITNTRSTKSLTTTTIKNSSSSTTTTMTRSAFSSGRKIDGVVSVKSTTGNKLLGGQVVGTHSHSSTNQSIPLGFVQIEELVETPANRSKKTGSGSPKELRAKGSKKSIPKADSEPINRNLNRSGCGQVTKSEMTKTTAPVATVTSIRSGSTGRASAATLNIHRSNTGDGATTGQDKRNKVVNKSRENSPKRSGSSSKGNSVRGTKATLKTGESLKTPVIKVDGEEEKGSGGGGDVVPTRTTTNKILKKDNNKTEESIIRELDILDNFLSQRSISIDEASVKESRKVNGTATATTTATMEPDQKKVIGGGNQDLDVMEAGIEPPFTRTVYKYNCPGEDHHHRHKDHGDGSTELNTNEMREAPSARNRDHDTKLNSNIEDEIIVNVDETTLVSTRVGKSESKPTTKANLSTNSITSKSNVKKSSPLIEQLPTKKVVSTFSKQSRQSSSEKMQSKQQKYEADNLNRSSTILEQKKMMTGKKSVSGVETITNTSEEKVKRKPDPNPRAKKSFDDDESGDGEKDYGRVVNANVKTGRRNVNDNDEDDDDPLRPQTMKQGQDNPGAVLQAKSLFESKAQEAAMDRTSADFDIDKGITQSSKVSKKAAIFEARSRGERISISSESSIANSATEDRGETTHRELIKQDMDKHLFSNNNLESPSKVNSTALMVTSTTVPTMKREKSVVTSASTKQKENKQDSSTITQKATTTTSMTTPPPRSTARKSSNETTTSSKETNSSQLRRKSSSEVKFDMHESINVKTEQVSKTGRRYQSRRDSGKSEKSEDEQCSRVNPEQGKESRKIESSTTRRASQEKKTSPEPTTLSSFSTRRNERRRSSTSSQRKNSLPEPTVAKPTVSSGVVPTRVVPAEVSAVRSDKFEQDENKRVETGNTITMTSISSNSTSVQLNSNRMTTTELNAVDGMEDIEELTRILEKATDYDERSKIRGRIRALKRKAALRRPSVSENEAEVVETSSSTTAANKRATGFTTSTTHNVNVSTTDKVNIMNAKNKAVSAATDTKNSVKNFGGRKYSTERRRSSGEIPSNKVTSRKKSNELPGRKSSNDDGKGDKGSSGNIEGKRTKINKSIDDALIARKTSLEKGEDLVTVAVENFKNESTTTIGEERRFSFETQQLLSTRKYSRESPRREDPETAVTQVILGPSMEATLEEREPSLPPPDGSKPFLSKKCSRDKISPPRAVSSLIESVSASTTMQKSREMTKAEKYEADILSRPSIFCKRRQQEQEQEGSQQVVLSSNSSMTKRGSTMSTTATSNTNRKVSSRKNSDEISGVKRSSPEPSSTPIVSKSSRRDYSDDLGNKGAKLRRKSSNEESPKEKSPPPTRVPQRTPYVRKGSSTEFRGLEEKSQVHTKISSLVRDSAERSENIEKIEMISKIPTTLSSSQKGGASTNDDQKSKDAEDDKHKFDTEINFNQEQQSQSSSPPTLLQHPSSNISDQQPQSISGLKKAKNASGSPSDMAAVKIETSKASPLLESSDATSTFSTRMGSTTTKSVSKSSSNSNSNAKSSIVPIHSQGTESVTSSYGVGPTDDFGAPLFGLKALRKIKQAQEQFAATSATTSDIVTKEEEATSKDDMKQSLRSNENFGLRALKKGAGASKGLLLEEKKKSSVPKGSTRESKSEFLSSTTATTRLQSKTSPNNTTITTLSDAEQGGTGNGAGNSPKSILKKTSSFTSSIGTSAEGGSGVVKSKTEDDDNNSDEIESGTTTTTSTNFVRGGDQKMSNEFTRSSTTAGRIHKTTTTTTDPTHSSNLGLDDSSWRRKSATPSPDPTTVVSSTTTTTTGPATGSFSRGKVGRSSVKEMSRKFESSETTGETLRNCQSPQDLNDDDGHKSTFIRGTSPSRIPSPIKGSTTTTTITTTTKSSVEVSGGGNNPENIKIEMNRGEPSDHEEVSYYSPSDSDGGSSGIIRITRTVTVGGSGRSFLNDSSPIQNISDVIERMKGEEGQRKYTEDFNTQGTINEENKDGDGGDEQASSEDGLSLLNKFIGAQIILQSVEPILHSKKVTMSSSSLIVNGVNVDVETDTAKLRQLLAEVDGGDRDRIEHRLRSLESGTSVERSSSTSFGPRPRPLTKTLSIGGVTLGGDSSDVADVTGELMPLILGQLQSSLDIAASGSASGGGGSIVGNIHQHHNIRTDNSNNTCTNTNANALQNAADTNTNSSSSSSDEGSSSSSKCSNGGGGQDSGEDCLFDSGTESGEDASPSLPPVVPPPPTSDLQPQHAKSESSPAEFSNFMEGLRNTLKRNQNKESLLRSLSHFDALGVFAAASRATVSASDSAIAAKALQSASGALDGGSGGFNLNESSTSGNKSSLEKESCSANSTAIETEEERNLIQQVDKVLSLLRDSLLKDPSVLKSLGCSDAELNPDSEKGKELIALIDRLKSSLSGSTESGDGGGERRGSVIKEKNKEPHPALPTVISTCEQKEKVTEQPGMNTTAAARAQEMLAWAQIRPPDTVPLPWVNHMQPPSERKSSTEGVVVVGDADDHYAHKGRGGRRRSHARSHTVGVTQEELAEARRYLQESAYRLALEERRTQKEKKEGIDDKLPPSQDATVVRRRNSSNVNANVTVNPVKRSSSKDSAKLSGVEEPSPELGRQHSWTQDVEKGLSNMPRPFVKAGMFDKGYVPPPERRMTCATLDDTASSLFGSRDVTQSNQGGGGLGKAGSQFAKIKPFRTVSLDNAYDPSKTFFTKEETVQIAIHKAAIKKQMSDEEARRARRSSLSSQNNIYSSGSVNSTTSRDFSLAYPTPYSSPQQQQQQKQKKMQSSVGDGNGSLSSSFNNASPNSNRGGVGQNQAQSGGDSGFTEESGSDSRQLRNDQLVLYETSQMSPISLSRSSSTPRTGFTTTSLSPSNQQQRIENVQISLKELNSSEFPQLQIAITLNTNAGNNGSGNKGNNGGNSNGPGCNNSITSNNGNSGINDPTLESHFLAGRNLPTNAFSGSGNSSITPNQIMDENFSSTSSSKANRYKSKKERKNRLKRANTIDIPQPPGFPLGHHDDTSEMDDEEEEDSDMNDQHHHGSIKTAQFTYAPFKPKSDGDHKFLAFLEKSNEVADRRSVRPAHLGVNDKFWNNRFFNLKSNFESSSQGSSPSPSPILSPNRHAPRSVSEMALTHETIMPSSNGGQDSFSRPIWANRNRGLMPQQVKNKLQVFESKNAEAQSKDIPWRSSAPHIGQTSHAQNQISNMNQQPPLNAKQFVASSSVYSTNNVPLPPAPQSSAIQTKSGFGPQQNFDKLSNVQRPVAVRGGTQQFGPGHFETQPPIPRLSPQHVVHPLEGVHIVHATASALEAMNKSGFGTTPVVHPNVIAREPPHQQILSPISHQHHQQILSPVPPKLLGQEKIELPWAKKEPSVKPLRDLNAGRILMSKAKFEQLNQPEVMHLPSSVARGGESVTSPPPIPPKSANAKAFGVALSQNQGPSKAPQQSKGLSSIPNVTNLANNYRQHPPAPAVGPKPKFVTQSFDEPFNRNKIENDQPKIGKFPVQPHNIEPVQQSHQQKLPGQNLGNHNKPQPEYQHVPGSAFARKVSSSEQQSRRASGEEGNDNKQTPNRKPSIEKPGEGIQIQTPVVARVMGAAQQQRAAIAGNRMSSLQNEEHASRLTNARSNIRNILNQFSTSQQSNDDSSDNNCSPPILKANLQLQPSLPNPLAKSLSGNTFPTGSPGQGASGYRPTSLVVGTEELSLHSANSPSLKPYNASPNNSLTSSLSPNPLPTPSSMSPLSPQPTASIKGGTPIPSPVHHHTREDSERSKRSSLQPSSQHRSLIPKQRSLSEFPKIATPPNIGVLTIQTDLESLTKQKSRPQQQSSNVPHHNKSQTQVPVQQPLQGHRVAFPVQKQASFPQQKQLAQQMQEQSSPKVLKSYPTSDSLQRTSSGSSIFNRAQSLFLSTQEGMPPTGPKPPSLPKTHRMFPKQFEAQMSPDSAKNKQKEVEAYFKQLTQQSPPSSKKSSTTSKSAHLRKSASHSKILNRQRSLSDGEEDVDQIFESLFKASEERFSFNRSQISRAWAQSSSKSLDMMSVVGNEGIYPNPTTMQPPFGNQNRAYFGEQMQTLCESKRLPNFNRYNNDLPASLMKPQLPPIPPYVPHTPRVAATPTLPQTNVGVGISSNQTNSQLQLGSQIVAQQSSIISSSSSSSSTSFKSNSSSTTSTSSSVGGGAGVNKFKQMDQQAKATNTGGAPLFKFANQGLKTSANNAKDILLYWCQCRTRDYENVKIENFSSSWSDGLAFCALIHHFYPDAFDYNSLDPRNRRFNFDLAFRVADEKAGIYPLLDTEDMIVMGRRPDWKCVFTYVQSMYRTLKDLS